MSDPWTAHELIPEGPIAAETMDNGARAMSLAEVKALLASPDDRSPMREEGEHLIDGAGRIYPIVDGRPWLLPRKALDHVHDGTVRVPVELTRRDAFAQYLYLADIKASGWAANSEPDDPWFLRHMHRAAALLATAKGRVLDVGCDNPDLSRRLFPSEAAYVGLEPALRGARGFSVAGMAEFLPFDDAVFDGVSLMTSLDHVLDYHAATDEAWRVLAPGGSLYLATLIWTQRAELYRDDIHFHHFREFEIRGALAKFRTVSVARYGWKGDAHRHGVYIHAIKDGAAQA